MSKARIRNMRGEIVSVDSFGEFRQVIGGESFDFIITADVTGLGYNVTHKPTGFRACTIDDSLDTHSTLTNRGIDCLTKLVERIGAARMRSILAGAHDLPSVKFLAGWNLAGCLPESPFEEFDTFESAKSYVMDELGRVVDDLIVGDCPREADAAEKAIEWVCRQVEPFCIGPVNQYHYEVSRTK